MTIHNIVLTGGPGGGKTTALECVAQRLEEHGITVFTVPEMATMLFNAGVNLRYVGNGEPANAIAEQLITLQSCMLNCQLALEDSIRNIANSADKDIDIVILHDRGTLDPKAFVHSPVIWEQVLERTNQNEMTLINRYDGVVHLMSAAAGAAEHYTTENNAARSETVEEARLRDKLIQEAWIGHPHFRIVNCYSDFSDKISHIMKVIYRIVGIPEPVEIERKFLVKNIPEIFPVKYVDSFIEQIYLKNRSRIRCRNFGEYNLYTHTFKKEIDSVSRTEEEYKIARQIYNILKRSADTERITIKKIRRCFLWDRQYFELDIYIHPREGLKLLELELEESNQDVRLPPFIEIEREVTDEKEFANSQIAIRKE